MDSSGNRAFSLIAHMVDVMRIRWHLDVQLSVGLYPAENLPILLNVESGRRLRISCWDDQTN